MPQIIMIVLFYIFLSLQVRPLIAETNWIRVGYYWYSPYQIPISHINSSLFTHIICAYVSVNPTSYQLSLSPADEEHFSTFTNTVKQKNPYVTTLLSIGGGAVNYSTFSSMVSNSFHRKSFINSSIKIARLYGFQGLDFAWQYPNTSADMFNMGVLFQEWRAAVGLEATNSNQSQLILTAKVTYSPSLSSTSYPIEKIQQCLNWVHVLSRDYTLSSSRNFTAANTALYDPSNFVNTDEGIREWIEGGLSANRLVLILTLYGYAWTLENAVNNNIGARAKGPAIRENGILTYKEIKKYIELYGPDVHVIFNSTYVVNYWTKGTTWISFDDVEAIKAKVSYAKEKMLLGYYVWQVSYDVNWLLSKTAAGVDINDYSVQKDNKNGQNNKRPVLVIFLSTTAAAALLFGIFAVFYCWRRNLKLKGTVNSTKESKDKANKAASAGDFNSNVPNLIEYSLPDIEAATNGFSIENKLGQGGYGPVYKGILPDGQVIAVKKLSKTSTQGFEEFKNEVMLTAKLQHVNLVRVLGFCIDKEEQILIYEYMRNRSLDSYLFDPIRRFVLDWEKRVHIIEGVTQALLYLQEYSRLTIIHRDLKASNVLLDGDINPKISDFGMARIFTKDGYEANTSRIVGTMHESWIVGKGMEFMDESLDDTYSSCKLMRCLQIALLCVQENPIDRPSMLEIFAKLKNVNTDMMIPKKPAFSKQNEQKKHTRQLEGYSGSTSSINDVTISDLVAR